MANFSDYKSSNNKGHRYIFVILGNFSNYLWAIPLKTRNSQTTTQEVSKILTTSKRSPVKLESDRGAELYSNVFQNLLESKNIQH